jgi:hypothetical protein
MTNGSITEFVKADVDADRLKLACHVFRPRSLLSLAIDDCATTGAWRRHSGAGLYA